MKKILQSLLGLVTFVFASSAVSCVLAVEFERKTLTTDFLAEGAFYADFNRDGALDIAYGPYVFYGPDFQKKEAYREVKKFKLEGSSDQFLCFADDCDGDGYVDIIQVPHPGMDGYWWKNPGKDGGEWRKFFISKEIGNESQVYADVDGDGRKDLVFNRNNYIGFATYDPKNNAEWKWRAVSEKNQKYHPYYHGIGAGDVNSDGLCDVIESQGWYENPGKDAPNFQTAWEFHPFPFANRGATMCVYDVDGDGLNDVVTAWDAHLYGLLWWKATKDAEGKLTFSKTEILPIEPTFAEDEFRYTQMHALDCADINGDGRIDFVTGKRWWAHGPNGDKEADQPAVLYWYENCLENGKTVYKPRLIDDNSGVGTQITVGDLNGDGKPDVLSANKKGCAVFIQK